MKVTVARPWLVAEFGTPLRVLSWTMNRPGFATAPAVVWREVRDADLTADFDVSAWLERELAEAGHADAGAFITSRNIERHHHAAANGVEALATVGLSNAERIGRRGTRRHHAAGTINILVEIAAGLTEGALVEAVSLAAEARTAAILDTAGGVTGTGTDCIAIAAPPGAQPHAGKHTALGEAIGSCVYQAVRAGAREWLAEHPRTVL